MELPIVERLRGKEADVAECDWKAARDMIEAAKIIEALAEALDNQLNDCINFDGGKLTDSIMTESAAALALAKGDGGCGKH